MLLGDVVLTLILKDTNVVAYRTHNVSNKYYGM
jgi:hypothetical protein